MVRRKAESKADFKTRLLGQADNEYGTAWKRYVAGLMAIKNGEGSEAEKKLALRKLRLEFALPGVAPPGLPVPKKLGGPGKVSGEVVKGDRAKVGGDGPSSNKVAWGDREVPIEAPTSAEVGWVYHRLALVEDVGIGDAPSPGAYAMLMWAAANPDLFFKEYAAKAVQREWKGDERDADGIERDKRLVENCARLESFLAAGHAAQPEGAEGAHGGRSGVAGESGEAH